MTTTKKFEGLTAKEIEILRKADQEVPHGSYGLWVQSTKVEIIKNINGLWHYRIFINEDVIQGEPRHSYDGPCLAAAKNRIEYIKYVGH